jgi:hypothetical protein
MSVVIRVNKTTDYTVMSNSHLREKRMSLKAKGLLSLMLSLPDDWDYSLAGLTTQAKDGRDSIANTLLELEEFGYLTRSRVTDSCGRFVGYDYNIYETPQDSPQTEKPFTENPNTVSPNSENPIQINTNILNTKKLNTKEQRNNIDRFVPPTIDEVAVYCLERNNKVDPERFVDYYTSNGWFVGKKKMVDWKAAVRTWEKRKDTQPDKTEQTQKPVSKNPFVSLAMGGDAL